MATKNLPEPDNTVYGIVSILCGIMSWIVLGIVFAPISIVVGIIGVSKEGKNKSLSAIGLCLGIISLIILIIGFSTLTTLQTRLK